MKSEMYSTSVQFGNLGVKIFVLITELSVL